MDVIEFGAYLKELRLEKGITLNKLADDIGFSNAYLSQIETGKKKKMPTPEFLQKISESLDVSYSVLLNKAGYDELSIANNLMEENEDIYIQLNDLRNMNAMLKMELTKNAEMENYFNGDKTVKTLSVYRDGKFHDAFTFSFRPHLRGIELTSEENEFILSTIESLIKLRKGEK